MEIAQLPLSTGITQEANQDEEGGNMASFSFSFSAYNIFNIYNISQEDPHYSNLCENLDITNMLDYNCP